MARATFAAARAVRNEVERILCTLLRIDYCMKLRYGCYLALLYILHIREHAILSRCDERLVISEMSARVILGRASGAKLN